MNVIRAIVATSLAATVFGSGARAREVTGGEWGHPNECTAEDTFEWEGEVHDSVFFWALIAYCWSECEDVPGPALKNVGQE